MFHALTANQFPSRRSVFVLVFSGLFLLSGCSQVRQMAPGQQSKSSQAANANQQAPAYSRSLSQSMSKRRSTSPFDRMPRSEAEVRQRVVNMAGKTLGSRYRYGGDNPAKGFDCSGLMRFIHKRSLGIEIPRTAAKQRDKSRTIPYAALKPGDMLFFKTGRRSNHVGIYIGNRQFIHASTGKKRVMVSKMDSAYWHRRFVKFGTFL